MAHKILKRRKVADPSRYYIDHDEYTGEVVKFIKTQVASERLGEIWKMHVDKCASAACFKSYTYLDEMKGCALLFLVKYSKSFNPKKILDSGKAPNAFKYCTSIIHNAFIQVINKEKKHSKLKDKIIKLHQRIVYNLNNFTTPSTIDD
jgi:hypothetical protein